MEPIKEKNASIGIIAIFVIVLLIVASGSAYYFLSSQPPTLPESSPEPTPEPTPTPEPDPDAKVIGADRSFEDNKFVYRVDVEVINNGGDGWVRVFAEKKQYETTETLEYRIYLESNERKFMAFMFTTDPYVKEFPSPTPTPTRDPDAPQPTPPPITTDAWAEPD